jgi:hypothetical protein
LKDLWVFTHFSQEEPALSESEKQKFTKDAKNLELAISKMRMQMEGANYGKAPLKVREQHLYVGKRKGREKR